MFRCISLPACDPSSVTESEAIVPRSVEHTCAVAEYFELGTLWEEYGLVGDVIVSFLNVLALFND